MSSAADLSLVPPPVTCVGARVDWLEPRFCVHLSPDVLAHFVRDPKDPHARAPRDAKSFVARAALARKFRVASVSLPIPNTPQADWPVFQMKMSGESKTVLTNGTCRIVIQENAPKSPDAPKEDPGWNVSIAYSGTSLMAIGWEAAARDAVRLASALGEVVVATRLGRLDLCGDLHGFPVDPEAQWCTRPQLRMRSLTKCKRLPVARAERSQRAKTAIALARRFERGSIGYIEMLEQMPDLDDAYYYPAGNLTGWKFGKGAISARIYDKHAEMRMRAAAAGSQADKRKQAGDKREAEETWWRAHGWTGGTVVRVEVQLRGPVLHELDARCDMRSGALGDPADRFVAELRKHIDRCWRYFAGAPDELARREALPVDAEGRCVKCAVVHGSTASCPHTLAPRAGWLRQIELAGSRPRSECSATAAWRAVQAVTFERVVTEIPRRTRKRGAVRATQVLGCALALLGFVERLEHPRNPVPDHETGECDQVVSDSEDLHARRVFESGRGKALFREQLKLLFEQTADEVADTLEWIHEQHPEDTLALLWTRQNAALARFKPHLAKAAAPFKKSAGDSR